MISEAIQNGKKMKQGCFIKVKVDIDNLKISAAARTDTGWENLGLDSPIPLDILDRYSPPNISDQMSDTEETSSALS